MRFSSTYRMSRNAHSVRQPDASSELCRSMTSAMGGVSCGAGTCGAGTVCANPSTGSWNAAVRRRICRWP
jgi:hypothetical protein